MTRTRFRQTIASIVVVALVIAPIPRPVRAATETAAPADSYNCADGNPSLLEAQDTAAKSPTAKGRTAPVSTSGSFTSSVPIDVPPGRLGMTPKLQLTYDSASAQQDSSVGAGWSLSIATITRSASEGFARLKREPGGQLTYDNDQAIFNGPDGPLTPATNGPSGSLHLYAPAREHEPVRYEFVPDSNGGSWIQHVSNGVKRHYGRHPVTEATAKIVNEVGIHAWLLLIPSPADQNPCAQSRKPRDMMRQG
jgi:hypothetical protein